MRWRWSACSNKSPAKPPTFRRCCSAAIRSDCSTIGRWLNLLTRPPPPRAQLTHEAEHVSLGSPTSFNKSGAAKFGRKSMYIIAEETAIFIYKFLLESSKFILISYKYYLYDFYSPRESRRGRRRSSARAGIVSSASDAGSGTATRNTPPVPLEKSMVAASSP